MTFHVGKKCGAVVFFFIAEIALTGLISHSLSRKWIENLKTENWKKTASREVREEIDELREEIDEPEKPVQKELCKSEGCLKASEYFKSNMNLSADPCNDFFNFVCGGFVKKMEKESIGTARSPDQIAIEKTQSDLIKLLSSSGSAWSIVNQAKSFFQKCVNSNTSEEFAEIRKAVKDFGGFPMFDEETYDKEIPWYVRSAKVISQFGRIAITEPLDIMQGSIFNFHIHFSIFTLLQPNSYYLSSAIHIERYNDTIESSICNVLKKSCSGEETENLSKQIAQMIQFQRNIFQIVEENANDQEEINSSVNEFNRLYPELHIFDFLNELFKYSGIKIYGNRVIWFMQPNYWRKLSQLINRTDPEVIDNLIGWSNFEILKYTATLAPENEDLKKKIRQPHCYEMTEAAFSYAISRLYVENYFKDTLNTPIKVAIQEMKVALIELIKKKVWLTQTVKDRAIDKIELIGYKDVGYPRWIMIDDKLTAYYRFDGPNRFPIEMYSAMYSFQMKEKLITLDYPHYKAELWTYMPPHSQNAAYVRPENKIILPATQLVPPMFWSNATLSLRYGSMFVIGHELVHSVDTLGAPWNAFGDKKDWWDGTSMTGFLGKVQCIINQFDAIVDKKTNLRLKGNFTNAENTADYGGLRTAYRAFMNNRIKDERLPGLQQLSDKKLFFVTAGMRFCFVGTKAVMEELIKTDVHSLHPYRVYMPPANMKEFSKTFNCPTGSKMNLKDKCVIW